MTSWTLPLPGPRRVYSPAPVPQHIVISPSRRTREPCSLLLSFNQAARALRFPKSMYAGFLHPHKCAGSGSRSLHGVAEALQGCDAPPIVAA